MHTKNKETAAILENLSNFYFSGFSDAARIPLFERIF